MSTGPPEAGDSPHVLSRLREYLDHKPTCHIATDEVGEYTNCYRPLGGCDCGLESLKSELAERLRGVETGWQDIASFATHLRILCGNNILAASSRSEQNPSWLPSGFSFLSGLPEQTRKRRFIMPVQVFADESGGKGQGRHFVMVGLIAEAESWALFSDEWRACLDTPNQRIGRSVRLFKMKDAAACRGEFNRWSEAERDAKLIDLARIINRHAKYVTASVIDLDVHAELMAPYAGKPRNEPYFWPFHNTIMAACFELWDKGLRERFEAIFDENVIFGPRAKLWYPVIRDVVAIREPEAHSIMPVEPIFKTDDEFLPLQACDLFAWCFRAGTNIGLEGERPFEWLLPELNHVYRSDYSQYYDRERMSALMEDSRRIAREFKAGLNKELLNLFTAKYGEMWGR